MKDVVEIKNKFHLLSTEERDHPSAGGKWKQIKDIYCNTSKYTLGYLRSTDKTWLSTDTRRRIEERKTIKSKITNTKSKIIHELLQLEYSIKDAAKCNIMRVSRTGDPKLYNVI